MGHLDIRRAQWCHSAYDASEVLTRVIRFHSNKADNYLFELWILELRAERVERTGCTGVHGLARGESLLLPKDGKSYVINRLHYMSNK